METQTRHSYGETEFLPGTQVIYGVHGTCTMIGTETRTVGGRDIQFYRLEVKKSALSRSQKHDPAIWVPVASAKEQGLRMPMATVEAEAALNILKSREYYFQLNESWSTLQHTLEACVRKEGGLGLAKVASFLYVYRRKLVVSPSEVNKLGETIHRLLFRELSDALGEPAKVLEERVQRGLRSKLLPDH